MAFAIALVVGACLQIAPAQAQAAVREQGAGMRKLSASDLVQVGQLSGLSLSPDQKYVVARLDRDNVERNQTELTWYRVRLRDGRVNRVCDAGGPLWDINGYVDTAVAQWSADGKWIYFRRLEKQQLQVWRCSADGARREQMTRAEADVQDFIIDGDRTLHVALVGATRAEIIQAESREYDAGVLMDQTTIPGFPIVRSFPHNGRMVSYRTLRPRDSKWGRTPLLGDRPFRIVSMNLPDPVMKLASPLVEARFAESWSGNGYRQYDPLARKLLESTDGLQAVREIPSREGASGDAPRTRSGSLLEWKDNRTGRTAVCIASACTDADYLSPAGWTSDGKGFVFQTVTFGVTGLQVWDVASNTVRTVASSETDIGSDRSGSEGSCRVAGVASFPNEAICLASGADSPPQLVAVSLSTGKQRILFDPNASLRRGALGVARKITVTDRWGGEAIGRLILPRSWIDLPNALRPRLPLVVTSYSCPGFLTGGSGGDVPEHVLVGLGYAAICIDMSGGVARLGAGFDQRVDNNDRMLDLFENAVRTLDKEAIVDPTRVTVSGFSASASAVTYALIKSTAFTASIITTQGYLDPMTCYLNSAQGLCRAYNKQYWSLPYDGPDGRFAESSPATHVTQIRTPLLMQLADVEYQAMMQLHSAMLDYDRPVEMYVFPDEYHNKRQPRHRLAVYNRNVAWIEFWLQGRERTGGDAQQYLRWQGMLIRQCQLFAESLSTEMPWYCRSEGTAVQRESPGG